MPSFAVSICVLSLVQAALVALPAPRPFPWLQRLRAPAWAMIPAASILVVVIVLRLAAGAAVGITYLALVAVPVLAAVTLAVAGRGARPRLALLVVPLFALAWADRGALAGESAALALSALSCVTLGTLLAGVAPVRWLKVGIVVMAMVDAALVVSELLQAPNNALNAAAPAAGLPRLQDEVWGNAVMGYGDLFIAATLGAVLAADRLRQRRAAWLAAALALAFNLLFFWVHELPATVPIAVALLVFEWRDRRAARRDRVRRTSRAAAPPRASPSRLASAEEDLGGRV
jgi:hypothetical protein